ncbi:three-helix bundle dimerization domain-containing protein [Mycobacterium riyadhense]|uniref:Uncharacterized protein n=1 Tax=Mycobacterium riyadhense TaxID=486698 RepID=A0A1X2BKZ0_9MYCO|nr:hypothetical protein [Mycobacterium riyadhense]MCV7148290.1 hypothetical protein [Mycobacterium riyadhense]ORW64272.1 hypothetical protein AWC22_03170 [Mycobacterium riyadhense]
MTTISEELLFAAVERRLTSNFGHLPAEQVSGAVLRARERFEHSPIRDFVSILVERHARAELSMSRQPSQ